jgi:GNAT superfamily N-acetyltransferase
VADDQPLSLGELAPFVEAHRAWVAVDPLDEPVGYLLVGVVDGCAHPEQVSVRPDHQGEGAGRALVDATGAWAAARGLAALTLTTFADVPWNRPLYEHLGFRVLADDEIGPELQRVQMEEPARGLDPDHRVCMRRDVSG